MDDLTPPCTVFYFADGETRQGLLVRETARSVHVVLLDNPIRLRKLPRSAKGHMTRCLNKSPTKMKKQLYRQLRLWANPLDEELREALLT